MAFNPNDRKYKFCCCCPSVVGATVFSTLETIVIGSKLYQALNIYFNTMENPSIITVISAILLVVLWGWYFGALVCIYLSVCRPHPNYVLPKLTLVVVQLALLILAAIGIICYFTGGAYATNNALVKIYEDYSGDRVEDHELDNIHRHMKYSAMVALGVIVLLILYTIWFIFVMRSYYRYVKDKAASLKNTVQFHPVPTAPPPPPYNAVYEKK